MLKKCSKKNSKGLVEKEEKGKKMEKNSAITLVALVITVIVLLIIAGVTISALSGDNGILQNAVRAKEETERAQEEEMAILDDLNSYIENGEEEKFDEEKGVNKPELTQGMIPVKFDTSKNGGKGNWVICSETDSEWYSYTELDKKWANVMLCDGTYDESTPVGTEISEEDLGSMFVWIPRYAYKITSGYHDTPNGGMDVKFLVGRTNQMVDNSTVVEYNAETTNNYTEFPDGYVVHPAFENGQSTGYQNGEWKKEITGIWVAKFKAGIKTTEKDTESRISSVNNYYYPVYKGRKYGYNNITTEQSYDISLALDDNENPYGLTESSNSHLMKNSEWGAVAYLSMSQYGYSEGTISISTEKYRNNLSIVSGTNTSLSPISHPNNNSWKITAITGYTATGGKTGENVMEYTNIDDLTDVVSGSNGTSYAWNNVNTNSDVGNGTKSSTTGNIYGIYDMGGCLAEYTSSYINNTEYSGEVSSFVTGTSTYLSTAYPNIRTIATDFNTAYQADVFKTIYGDAVYETSKNVGGGLTWFGQTLENDTGAAEVFFPRGGNWYNTDTTGLCGLNDHSGYESTYFGFRSVLVVE